MPFVAMAKARKQTRLEHYIEQNILTLINNTMKREMNFECSHNTAENIMTCEWANGRVQLVHYFKEHVSAVKVDGELKDKYHGLTIPEFERLQEHCQDIADKMENKAA